MYNDSARLVDNIDDIITNPNNHPNAIVSQLRSLIANYRTRTGFKYNERPFPDYVDKNSL